MHPRTLSSSFACTLYFSCLLVLSTVLSASPVQAGEFQGQVHFSPGDLIISSREGYDFLSMKDPFYTHRVGAPLLPMARIQVALPTDAQVLSVKVLSKEVTSLGTGFHVPPAVKPIRLSDPPSSDPFQEDPSVYGKDALFPGTFAEAERSWDWVGQDFVTVAIYPVQYNPVTGELFLVTSMTFAVEYADAANPYRETYNFSPKVRRRIYEMLREEAFNPRDVSPLPAYSGSTAGGRLDPGTYEHVIITYPSFESAFQPLADWRTQMGIPSKIVTTTWIYSNYSGSNNAAKIRNFVKDANATWGTIYFLLGGDTAYVPYHTSNYNGDNIPEDTYYSDYDDDWTCEVFVGRASANNTTQVNTFVNKVLTYEKNPPAGYGNKVFFMGFDLDGYTDGEDAKKNIKSNYVPAWSAFVSEYDSEWGGHESDVKNYMNQGQNLVNHIDHGDTGVLGVGLTNHGTYLGNSEVQNFSNGTKYSNFYSIGCWTCNYASTCIAEYFVRDDHGGVSYVGNSRYGWYIQGSTSGASFSYDKAFWRKLYYNNRYILGETTAKSKNYAYYPDTIMKYIFVEITLLGDPALHLWTDDPTDLTVTYDATINTGSQTYTVNVKDGGANLEGALVCVLKDGEVYAYGTTDASGNVDLSIAPATAGTMTLTVTAQNFHCFEGSVDVQSQANPPVISDITPGYGLETGATPVTVTGANFTGDTNVKIGSNNCAFITVVNSSTITCLAPAGTNGWEDVTVENAVGNDTLADGFRYFPAGGDPFNAMDIHTESVTTPATMTILVSGHALNPYAVYLSYGPGPVNTPYGVMGLSFPIYYLFSLNLNALGYSVVPLNVDPGFGPVDFYLHVLGLNGAGDPVWSWGGNNPNGSGSIWIHLNN